MRKSLPSRLLFLSCVVSLCFGLVPSVFAAELTISSYSHIDGLTIQPPLLQPINQNEITNYDFSIQPAPSLTLDTISTTPHGEQKILSQDILEAPSFILNPIDLAPVVMTPSITPTPSVQQIPTTTVTNASTPPDTTPTKTTAVVTPSPTTTPTPTDTPSPTPPPTLPPIPPSTDIDGYFAKYSAEYHVDHDVLTRIARCESGFNAHAQYLDYGGMFQFATTSWIVTRQAMGQDTNPDLRFSAEEAIKTAAFKIARDGSGAWPSC